MDRWDLDRMPWMVARRDADGRMRLLPPHPEAARYRWLSKPSARRTPLYLARRTLKCSFQWSYFATWLLSNTKVVLRTDFSPYDPVEGLRLRPGYESLLGGWQPPPGQNIGQIKIFHEKDLPPAFEAALDFTAFGLDQFKERADRDGVSLVILSSHTMGSRGDPAFDRMNALAAVRGIPVIDQTDYIERQGFTVKEAHWKHDRHWNAAGHQWAAEALLEYLKRNPEVCAQRPGSPIVPDLTGR